MANDVFTPGGRPSLADYENRLGLPEGFSARTASEYSDKVAEVLELRVKHRRRNYLLGVLIAYIMLAEKLLSQINDDSVEKVLERFPPHEVDSSGKRLNTLTIGNPPNTISLRPLYNVIETVIRHNLLRVDYPNAAPHATQSWFQHQREFELICAMSPADRAELARRLWQEVLDLKEAPSDAEGEREVRPFEAIIEGFSGGQRGEPAGAVLQGLAYAYYRADSPSVTLRIFKVGSGSSRVGAAGDVDGWIGEKLALSVEVKDKPIGEEDLHEFDQFVKNLRRWPNCTAVALAQKFTEEAQSWLLKRNVLPLNRERMASNVAFWDIPKQQMAVREFAYYLAVIQQNQRLLQRFRDYCADAGIVL